MTPWRRAAAGLRRAIWLALFAGSQAQALELSGLVDLRAVASDTRRSWTEEGLGKQRFDRNSATVRLGQAILRLDAEPLDGVAAALVLSASDQRRGLVDVNEAWLGWSPVPTSAWKLRARLGAFFPASSLEIDYDSIGWTPSRSLSSSAINSWIGEELRTQGLEFSLLRKGRFEGSAHDFGVSAALFLGNDPAGSLMAWRGWAVGDRISGLREAIRLADLPVYRAGAPLASQDRSLHLFREIDSRPGYCLGANYGYGGWLEAAALHYDNRADALALKDRQYGWNTRFDHLSLRLQPGKWELLFQALRGRTIMGPDAVRLGFRAWYALASHGFGPGRLTLRLDRFGTTENDILPADPNGETGRALALAYVYPLNSSVSLVSELLAVRSNRPARLLLGEPADQTERSLSGSIRWQF